MATRTLGVAATGVAFAFGAIFQLFETQGWTMPDWLGVVLAIGIFVLVVPPVGEKVRAKPLSGRGGQKASRQNLVGIDIPTGQYNRF